jgi:hypothetical protein
MRIFLFIVLWMVFFLCVPMILHVWFSSNEYPVPSENFIRPRFAT